MKSIDVHVINHHQGIIDFLTTLEVNLVSLLGGV